jgi:hypothetical protein
MSEQFHDDDIEFDFFDDVDTREEPPPEERPREGPPPGGPRRPPQRPPGAGMPPRARLIALIAGAVVLVILLVFLVVQCTGESKKGSYESYMEDVSAVAASSQKLGRDLDEALTTPGIEPNELATKLDALATRQQQEIATAQGIGAPGALRDEHAAVVEALKFRDAGLRRLANVFRQTAGSDDASGASLRLSNQAKRLITSDIVWEDLFRAASIVQLRTDGVTGVAVPDSNFVQNPEFGSPGYWQPVFERVNGAATSGGGGSTGSLHGTGISETKALPSGKVLSTDQENIVTAGTDLGFAVTVKNTGDNQEVQVKVTLTIVQQPSNITATQTIASIDPGEEKTVTFKNLGNPAFATKTTVRVDVAPVPGEANADNNSAEYPVIFSLG